jgi:hypothetical protein
LEFLEDDMGALDITSSKFDVSSYTIVNSIRHNYTAKNSSDSSSEDEEVEGDVNRTTTEKSAFIPQESENQSKQEAANAD